MKYNGHPKGWFFFDPEPEAFNFVFWRFSFSDGYLCLFMSKMAQMGNQRALRGYSAACCERLAQAGAMVFWILVGYNGNK